MKKRRRFMTWLGLGALVILVLLNYDQLGDFWRSLHEARWWVLFGVVLVQIFSYWTNAKFYQSFFRIFNHEISFRRLYEVSLAINFVNHVFPTGGLSGASFLSSHLSNDVPIGQSTLAQLIKYFFTVISFLAVLTFGFVILFLGGGLNQLSVRLTLMLSLVIIVSGLLLLALLADRSKLEWLLRLGQRFINGFGRIVLRRHHLLLPEAKAQRFFNEFYQGYQLLAEQRGHWRMPLLYSLLGNIAEVLTIYVVFLAFDNPVSVGVVIVAYALANILSLLGIFGLFEATMVGAFVALGLPFSLSFSVVIVYRILNIGLFLPPGFYFYHRQI